MANRLNARVDDALMQKLERLRELSGQDTTEIIRASLEAYYEAFMQRARPYDLLEEFIGVAEGPADLSRDYKRELTKTLEQKHGR